MEIQECKIKNLLEMWVNINKDCFISSYNFIDKLNDNKYKISVNEKSYDDDIFLSIYEVWISDSEFRIFEIGW